MSLVAELKRRNVLRVTAAYVVVSWLIIQVAETVLPFYGVADSVIRWIITLLAIGLVPTLVLAWIFEFTPQGLKRDSEVDHAVPTSKEAARKLDRVIILVLGLALAFFAVDKFIFEPARDEALVEATTQVARSEAVIESYGDRSIAVLPFADMSVNRDQQYMSDGLAEELLNLLAQVPQLRVISRSSSFSFRGDTMEITEIGRRLNASYVLEGSVRQAGNDLRVTAQLIDARTDTHLWSQTYDRKLENIFQIQDEISAEVVRSLKAELLRDLPQATVVDEQAYQAYLQARYFWNRRDEGDPGRALDYYLRALEISPEYAPAWAGAAWAYSVEALGGHIDREDGLEKAREAAEKALEIDPDLVEAHVRMGQAEARRGNFNALRMHWERALELGPNNPLAMGVAAQLAWHLGDLDRSIEMFEEVEKVDPLSAIWPANRTGVLIRAGRFNEALSANERFFELSGNEMGRDMTRAAIYELSGRYEESLLLSEKFPENDDVITGLAIIYHHLGDHGKAEAMRKKLEQSENPFTWLNLAKVYARWGDPDRAFEQLTAENVGDLQNWLLRFDPHLQSIKSDPRWQPMIEQALWPYD